MTSLQVAWRNATRKQQEQQGQVQPAAVVQAPIHQPTQMYDHHHHQQHMGVQQPPPTEDMMESFVRNMEQTMVQQNVQLQQLQKEQMDEQTKHKSQVLASMDKSYKALGSKVSDLQTLLDDNEDAACKSDIYNTWLVLGLLFAVVIVLMLYNIMSRNRLHSEICKYVNNMNVRRLRVEEIIKLTQ